MTSPPKPRTIGALVVLALFAIGCGTSTPEAGPDPSGSGTPTGTATGAPPATTPPPATTAPASVPPVKDGWPNPPDCIGYNPANVQVVQQGSLYHVKAGGTSLLTFSDDYEAETGMAVAKSYQKLCFIGRNTEPAGNVVTYWLDPSSTPQGYESSEANQCGMHDKNNLTVSNAPSGWRVRSGSTTIYTFETEDAALQAKAVLSHYDYHCHIDWAAVAAPQHRHEFHDFPDFNQ